MSLKCHRNVPFENCLNSVTSIPRVTIDTLYRPVDSVLFTYFIYLISCIIKMYALGVMRIKYN